MQVYDKLCGECRHWLADHSGLGECHRYPPQMVPVRTVVGSAGRFEDPVHDLVPLAHWPQVTHEDWCGEFAAAEHVPE